MKKDVYFYKVIMKNKSKNEETAVYSDFSYAFTNLDSATSYSFQVSYTYLIEKIKKKKLKLSLMY